MNITEEKLLEYLSKALVCVAVIVIGYIITRLIIGILRKILNKSRMDGTAEGFVLSVLKVIFYFIVAVTALGTIGVNVASLITALGAAALTAGLALQDLLKNVVSGLVILINKPFVSGNILDFEGVKGTVEEINIFSTTVHTLDNKLVTIPNSRLTSNNVVNCTMVEQRRVDCTFSVSYDDDIDKVREIILNLMATNEMILKDPEPTVRVGEHLDSGVQIKVLHGQLLMITTRFISSCKKMSRKSLIKTVSQFRTLILLLPKIKIIKFQIKYYENSVNNNGAVDSVPFYFYKD